MEPRSGVLSLLALLALPGSAAVTGEETFLQVVFFQESRHSQAQFGEFLQEFDGEEILHVDLDQKKTVWRLPDLQDYSSFDALNALAHLALKKVNLGEMKQIYETPDEHLVYQVNRKCYFPEGAAGPGAHLLISYIYERQEFLRFNSSRGIYEAVTELGVPAAQEINRDKSYLEFHLALVDSFCWHNYNLYHSFASARKVKPHLKIIPIETLSPSSPHTLLVCTVGGFFPAKINVTWLRNGQEEDDSKVISTNLIRNGDWTFHIQVMLEAQPKRGDVYTCQVEHASLPSPASIQWEPTSESVRSKMWMGVVGLLLGLVFLLPGLALYLKKRGPAIPPPAGPAIPPPAALMT